MMKKNILIIVLGVLMLFLVSCSIPINIPFELEFEFEFEAENASIEFQPTNNGEMREYEVTPPVEIPNPLSEEEIPLGANIKKIELTITATVTKPDNFAEFDYEAYMNLTEYSTDTSDLFVEGKIGPGLNVEEVSSEDYGGIKNLIPFLESDDETANAHVIIMHNYGKDATETAYGKLHIKGIVYVGF
ncbi:MAG: hypothetical protein ACP5D6_08225 [Kosmotogaceae bacterium]